MGIITDTDVLSITQRQEQEYVESRIKQLEQQCAVLAAEIDRMRPVVEATVREVTRDDDRFSWWELKKAVNEYEASRPK